MAPSPLPRCQELIKPPWRPVLEGRSKHATDCQHQSPGDIGLRRCVERTPGGMRPNGWLRWLAAARSILIRNVRDILVTSTSHALTDDSRSFGPAGERVGDADAEQTALFAGRYDHRDDPQRTIPNNLVGGSQDRMPGRRGRASAVIG